METSDSGLLIVGAGHAGSELAVAARQAGWPGAITLLGDEGQVPYHRPPLSKAYLCGKADAQALLLRSEEAYTQARVRLRLAAPVVGIDRTGRSIGLADGTRLAYDKLALCTGGRPRPLTCEGLDPRRPPDNLLYLRNQSDAEALRARLAPDVRVVIIGGGYIGLEVAASAIKLGARVALLEAQPRVLARVAGHELSGFYQGLHRAAGVDLRTGVIVAGVETQDRAITAVLCADGERVPADVVVAGLGMLPNVQVARDAGLADEAGIPVDAFSRTADPHVVAAGDCTLQENALYGGLRRIESVPNALEQARCAASTLAGKPRANVAVPWFWSDQYDLKLQMAGLSQGWERCVLRGDPAQRNFAAFYFRGRRLLAVDAVNRPAEFMLVKRLLAQPLETDGDLSDERVPLKELLAATPAGAAGKS